MLNFTQLIVKKQKTVFSKQDVFSKTRRNLLKWSRSIIFASLNCIIK